MNHLQNALYRLKNSATTASQQLIIGEVSQEILRIVDAYDRIEKTLKSTQEAAFWLLESLKTSANTQVSMFTQNQIFALRAALDKAGYSENGRCAPPGRDVTGGVFSPIGVAQLPVAPPVPIENAKLPVPQPMNLCDHKATGDAQPGAVKREWIDLNPIELAVAFSDKGSAEEGIRSVIAAFKEKNK